MPIVKPDADGPMEQYEEAADLSGFTLLELESEWWGNEKLGVWTKRVWGLIDRETDEAYHLAVVDVDDGDRSKFDTYQHDTDVWLPKSKSEKLVEPDWTTFDAKTDERKGDIYVAMERQTEYGWKFCLWGDTYDALAEENDDALGDVWDELHATYNDPCWIVDVVNGILIMNLTEAGYRVHLTEWLF